MLLDHRNALMIALEFVIEQARAECYITCGCQDQAEKTLKEVAEALGTSVYLLKKNVKAWGKR